MTTKEREIRRAVWDTMVKRHNLRCPLDHKLILYDEKEVFFKTGLCHDCCDVEIAGKTTRYQTLEYLSRPYL